MVCGLLKLVTLRCSMNRITHLPARLIALTQLKVLDVSHNRLERVPASMANLIRKLVTALFKITAKTLNIIVNLIDKCLVHHLL